MGIPLTVFTLHRLQGEGGACVHHLLLRVAQPGFNNADASDYDRAVDAAEARRRSLLDAHLATLAAGCGRAHGAQLIGEFQSPPVGDALSDDPGGVEVELWVAQTRFGAPWVVMGMAKSEEAFWRAVADDADLAGLGGVRPAERVRAFFLADDEETG